MASDGEYISCLPGQRSGDACIERPFALVGDIGSNLPLVVLGTRVVIQQEHPPSQHHQSSDSFNHKDGGKNRKST